MKTMGILNKIQKEFKAAGYVQVEGYKRFGFVRETESAIVVSREDGADTPISLTKIYEGIEAVKQDINIYDGGPNTLRDHDIIFINSPVWALLHLASKADYR